MRPVVDIVEDLVNEMDVDTALNYYHGTVKATNSELDLVKDYKAKTPMVYLKEIIEERIVYLEVRLIYLFSF